MVMVTLNLNLAFRSILLLLHLPVVVVVADGAAKLDKQTAALLLLRASFSDPTNALKTWSPLSPSGPCNATSQWQGVQCDEGTLVGLRLEHLNLSGNFDFGALAHLPGLHSINLKRNAFSGPVPSSLATVRSLRSLYLSYNQFTGSVPGDIFTSMKWLKKLYLDNNDFSGVLPGNAIAAAPRLLELQLEHNQIEGDVPEHLPASVRLFNVSHNRLTGVLSPGVVTRFNESAFAGNPGLCGAPGSDTWACKADVPVPSAMPPTSPADNFAVQEETSIVVVIGIILIVIVLVTGAMVLMLRQDERHNAPYAHPSTSMPAVASPRANAVPDVSSPRATATAAPAAAMEMGGGGSSQSSARGVGGVGGIGGKRTDEFVLMNKSIGVFGLSDMMKATAEVLGNGTLGSAYKASMRNGVTVAVKRMREMNRVGREEFEQHIRMLGELRHPNVLAPVGYHYRKEEKIIVSEYMPRGSLLFVLHGDQSANRVILDWPMRLRIAAGVARGMTYLHEKPGIHGAEFDAPPPHGNLKSGNILLDKNLEPRIVDYGFFPLVNPPLVPQAMFAFRSPEAAAALQAPPQQQPVAVSARSDVYCLGVVLLELVTGKLPSQYLMDAQGGGTDVVQWAAAAVAGVSEHELIDPVIAAGAGFAAVQLLRVAVECTEPAPECRPSMEAAARMVEELAGAAGSS